jgi:hypothetical protein
MDQLICAGYGDTELKVLADFSAAPQEPDEARPTSWLPTVASNMSRLTVGATQTQVGGKERVLRQEVLSTLNGVLSAVGSVTGQSTPVGGHNGIEEVLQLPAAR